MTVGWIAYVLAVSTLLALAARAAEAALRTRRRSLRWVWAAGLAATAAAPLAPRLIPLVAGRGAAGGSTGDVVTSGTGALADGASAAPAAGPTAEVLAAVAEALATPVPGGLAVGLGAAWAAASVVLLATLAGGWIRLRRRCRAWPEGRAAGEPVRVSRGTGPAAAGVLRPVVVVPAWLLRRGGRDLEFAVRHEREHARARDPALLAAGRALAALVPWNPFLWWQLRRLRLAVELDCDRRVLECGLPRRGYGRLLLEMSASPSGGLLRPAATLGERPTHLEERIRAMTAEPTARPSVLRSVLLVGLVLGLVAGACETPVPPSPADAPAADADRAAGDEGAGSTFRIRGNAPLDPDDRPLIYIDGAPVPLIYIDGTPVPGTGDGSTASRLTELVPDDIESIQVLKGQSAVDAYGEEAAAGVLLIETKARARGSG